MPPLIKTNGKSLITVACCIPIQHSNCKDKLEWLNRAMGETTCELFVTPQEFFGGHYAWQLSGETAPLHIDRDWLVDSVGRLAVKHGKHIGVGGCCNSPGAGATEDFLYIDDEGSLLGYHSKFALPSYDDMRTGGHGQLWPETNFKKRVTPIEMPKLRLKVGTVYCWEVFSQMLWGAYSSARVNLVTHPIKFAPRGWLKNKVLADGKKHIIDFGYAPKSQMWIDRLIMAGRHQVMCPIAVSCNSWNLGEKKMALVGHVDELRKTTNLMDVPSIGTNEKIHTFEMLPEWYEGLDYHHSAGAFKAHTGSVEGYSELGEYTMHAKIRRLEAQLIGDTTRMDCFLKAAAGSRQKKSTVKRALGSGLQKVKLPNRSK